MIPVLTPSFLLTIIFLTIVFSHIAKKNSAVVLAYGIQSLAIVMILFSFFLETGATSLLFTTLLVLMVKVILAPLFFLTLIKKHALKFLVSTYLNTPLTLIIIAALTASAHSQTFAPLTNIIPANHALLALALSAVLLSLFVIVNRKGAFSQIIGILSLENSILAFALFAGLEQSPGLQMGIIFDIAVWLVIATVFVSMLYRHFGTLDVTTLKHLQD